MMRLFDSKSKAKKDLNAYKNEPLNIYLCGATVYDDAHLGHARSSVCFDLLRRTLLALGFKVQFARNYTDIDDKILAKMKEKNLSLKELTTHYIQSYEADMNALNVLKPNFMPKATEYIAQMIELIESLEKKGFTYTLKDGVYFDSSKDSAYFSLSHRNLNDNQSRLENEVAKKNESDFVLWKFDESFYDAPFGKGRPGWHSECVAMIRALFDDKLIIHCGGADLLFPHHENEAAQCRCAYGGELAQIWLHNGFVKIDGEKMSKSLNNSFFVKDALKEFCAEALRFYLLQTHYRGDFNYAVSDLESAKKRLDKFYRLKKRLGVFEFTDYELNLKTNSKGFQSELSRQILNALNDDLNISLALSVFDEFIINSNAKLDENPKDKALKENLTQGLKECALIFGVGFMDTSEYFQFGVDDEFKVQIKAQIKARNEAKAEKNFALADEIRTNLAKKGIILQDTPNGTVWEKSSES